MNQSPSHLITASLPKSVTLPDQESGKTTINIIIHQQPVPVHFAEIDALVSQLYADRHLDFVLHTGVAPGIKHYEVETSARRSGYKTKDDSGGKPSGDEHPGFGGREGPVRFETCVVEQGPETVLRRWKEECGRKGVDLRISRDAGLFVCEYITYASLTYLRYQKNHVLPVEERTGVAFLHAPAVGDAEAVETGREVYVGLIRALVATRLRK